MATGIQNIGSKSSSSSGAEKMKIVAGVLISVLVIVLLCASWCIIKRCRRRGRSENLRNQHENFYSTSSQPSWQRNRVSSTETYHSTFSGPSSQQSETDNPSSSSQQYQQQNEIALPNIPRIGPRRHQQQYMNPSRGGGSGSHELHQPLTPDIAPPTPKKFAYKRLAEATNNFSKDNRLGSGGFGSVHKGDLGNGTMVAIKQLKVGSQQGICEFLTEVITLNRCGHQHLVKLIGYCIENTRRLLVYEFIANESLNSHLHGNNHPVLDWQKRFNIALGTAKALVYLHENCNGKTKIIHRDIKSENILLDERFEAKVADFGLARFVPEDETHVITGAAGTFGYVDPDYCRSGVLTEEVDTYSFGMVLLEMISGRPPMGDLALRAKKILSDAVIDNSIPSVDPRLGNNYNDAEMFRMIHCAAACIYYPALDRPQMSQILEALEGSLDVTVLTRGIRRMSSTG